VGLIGIKLDLTVMGWERLNWSDQAQDGDQWCALENAVTDGKFP
jgi:hypothetical protein